MEGTGEQDGSLANQQPEVVAAVAVAATTQQDQRQLIQAVVVGLEPLEPKALDQRTRYLLLAGPLDRRYSDLQPGQATVTAVNGVAVAEARPAQERGTAEMAE